MTPIQAQFDADVAAVEGDALVIFKFEGKEYTGQRTPVRSVLQMVEAGFELGYDFTLDVRPSQFDSTKGERPPNNTEVIVICDAAPSASEGQRVTEIEYRIVSVTPDQFGVVNIYALKQET